MEEMKSRVYVMPDSRGRILRVEGEYTLSNIKNFDEWVLVEEGPPCDRLNLAQSHYFPDGIYTEDGIPKYKLVELGIEAEKPYGVEPRTEEEIEGDREPAPEPTPTLESRVGILEIDSAETKEALEMILSGVTE